MNTTPAIGSIASAQLLMPAGFYTVFLPSVRCPTMQPATIHDYAELDCISNFTFLQGASHPHELVQQAARLGYRALALADECSMAGVLRPHIEARDNAI